MSDSENEDVVCKKRRVAPVIDSSDEEDKKEVANEFIDDCASCTEPEDEEDEIDEFSDADFIDDGPDDVVAMQDDCNDVKVVVLSIRQCYTGAQFSVSYRRPDNKVAYKNVKVKPRTAPNTVLQLRFLKIKIECDQSGGMFSIDAVSGKLMTELRVLHLDAVLGPKMLFIKTPDDVVHEVESDKPLVMGDVIRCKGLGFGKQDMLCKIVVERDPRLTVQLRERFRKFI